MGGIKLPGVKLPFISDLGVLMKVLSHKRTNSSCHVYFSVFLISWSCYLPVCYYPWMLLSKRCVFWHPFFSTLDMRKKMSQQWWEEEFAVEALTTLLASNLKFHYLKCLAFSSQDDALQSHHFLRCTGYGCGGVQGCHSLKQTFPNLLVTVQLIKNRAQYCKIISKMSHFCMHKLYLWNWYDCTKRK